jgi:penicillin G amidase
MLQLCRAWIVASACLLVIATPARAGLVSNLLNLVGLTDEVKVTRDTSGVPHISAKNEHDMLFLQGYTHAQDRLFQMDVSRRQADGTLAELLGSAALASDVQLRTFGLRRAAERSLPVLSQDTRNALNAYAEGVNAYVSKNPLPPEYAALEITQFRQWNAVDSISILKLIAFSLSFELTDLDRTTLLSQYQTTGATRGFNGSMLFFEDVNRVAPFNNAATVPDASAPPPGGTSASASLTVSAEVLGDPVTMDMARRYLAQVRALPFVQAVLKNPDDDRGSNQFIISSTRSLTGLPIVANDPHLALSAPSIWYENQISSPSFNAIGASFAGAPFVILGNNDRIAWGATNHLMDATDVYQERILADTNSPSGLSTMYNGNLEPVQALPQTFRANTIGDGVQNSLTTVPPSASIPAAVLIVPRRNNGPIISLNQGAGTAISVQYVGNSGTREVQAFRGINRATNLSQFVAALQDIDVGSQNFTYADTSGNIAYYTTGEVPLREDLQAGAPNGLPPFLIRNGQGGNEWLPAVGSDPKRAIPFAILPFGEMAQLVNPARGLIVNANNDPTGNNRDNNVLNMLRPGGGIRYVGAYGFDIGVRAGRIESLFAPFIAGNQKLGVADLQRFQSDVVMGDAQYFTPFIVQALANAQRAGAPAALASLAADAQVVEAVGRLAGWDRSTPTGIVEGFDASDNNGMRAQPSQGEIDNSIAATIYSVFRNQLVSQTLGATLSRFSLPVPTSRDVQIVAVKNLFDNFPVRGGVGVSGVDFFEMPTVAAAADRRDIVLLNSLRSALTLLASPAFAPAFNGSTNLADYRWGRLHRVVFAHPIGGPFSTPPAGGAFPQPLANLPGVPTDGGLYTVDVGNHPINANQSNGFMFTAGASRRYVASIKSNAVDSVSSLPGGESGVPGNQFNLNLLPLWLTNEAFPLVSNIDNSPNLVIRIDIFRPLLGGILR